MKESNKEPFRKSLNRSSDRSFGVTFGVVSLVLAFLPILTSLRYKGTEAHPRWYLIPISVMFFACAALKPTWLSPLNRGWFKLGEILQKITTPVVLTIVYFLVLTPMAFFARLKGRNVNNFYFDRKRKTYWIPRSAEKDGSGSFNNQF